jgi:hypothetical protein
MHKCIRDLILTYERATGACLNIRKSKAMAVGSWDSSLNMFDIPYYTEITILVFSFTSTIARSGSVTWSKVTGRVKSSASEVCARDLCLNTKNQICARLLTLKDMAHSPDYPDIEGEWAATPHSNFLVHMTRFDLQGAAIHLTASDGKGGLNLIDVAAKFRVFCLTRFWAQGERDGSLTAALLNVWALLSPGMNTPHIRAIPGNMAYLSTYFLEWACLEPQRQAEKHRTFWNRIFFNFFSTPCI